MRIGLLTEMLWAPSGTQNKARAELTSNLCSRVAYGNPKPAQETYIYKSSKVNGVS